MQPEHLAWTKELFGNVTLILKLCSWYGGIRAMLPYVLGRHTHQVYHPYKVVDGPKLLLLWSTQTLSSVSPLMSRHHTPCESTPYGHDVLSIIDHQIHPAKMSGGRANT